MSIRSKILAIVTLLAIVGLDVTACNSGTSQETGQGVTYKIGFNSSATGASASLGLPEAKTAEMIQKQINDQGGITGPDGVKHDVKIVIYDDESVADNAVSNVTRLIQEDEAVAVVSTTGSGTTIAHIPVCEENETPCISMASAQPITVNADTGETYRWMFKTPQTNGHAGEWQAAYLKATGVSSVCILYTDDGYGKDCLANFKATAEAAGLEIVYEGAYATSDTEFSAQIAQVQASGCQAVEVGSTPPVASLATVAVHTALPEIPITLGHGVCNQAFIDTAGAAANGTVFPCGKITVLDQVADSDPQKTVLQKYIDDYTAFTNGEPISTFGGHAWDAVEMTLNALESLNDGMSLEEQRTAVRDYLENQIQGWPGIGGVFTMSPADHNGLTKESLLFVTVEDGRWVAFPESEW
ncbi:MAG: ABC transporter substrate-binding protein [Anaerolineae bacterium]|nr:ABC transporter substrate-binding protein [Anaerolineae bacterium]